MTDIKYSITMTKTGVEATTNNTYYIIPKINVKLTLLKSLHAKVQVIYPHTNTEYLPAGLYSEANYNSNDLIKIAISKLLRLLII